MENIKSSCEFFFTLFKHCVFFFFEKKNHYFSHMKKQIQSLENGLHLALNGFRTAQKNVNNYAVNGKTYGY